MIGCRSDRWATSRIITVSFTSTVPEKAARIANAIVKWYQDGQLVAKQQATGRATLWADARVAQLRQEVASAENAIADYMAAKGLARTTDGGLDAQQLTKLQDELAIARADRAAKEAKLDQVHDLAARKIGYASLPEVASSHIIITLQQQDASQRSQEAQLTRTYGREHPSVLQAAARRSSIAEKIADEIANIVRNFETDVAFTRGRERALEDALARAKTQYAASEHAAVKLRELTQTAAAKRTLYEGLLARSGDIGEQQALLEPDSKVVSAASVPTEASFPKIGATMGAGILGSLLLGTILAALSEHLDHGMRTTRQVREVLGLANLGLVPRVKRLGRRGRLHTYVLERPRSAYAEAIRAIHTGIQLFGALHPMRVLLVTSSLPGEGKTTLAMSLGALIAQGGRKVIVVDLDLRHPSVARELGRPVQAGITEFITGERTLDEVVQVEQIEGRLHVLPVRMPVENPGDLLTSLRLRSLIADLRVRYDNVVLDLPPSLGISDVQTVGLLADAMLFVVQWGKTTDMAAVNGLEALQKTGVAIVGAALTQVDLAQHARLGYRDAGEYYPQYRRYFRE